jgi:glycosyltransferase involved in cell wall biosynthesis
MANLMLYTDSYPYNRAETFLETEIWYLSKVFDSICIRPMTGGGKSRDLPVNVHVLESMEDKNCSKATMYFLGFINSFILFSEKSLRRNLSSVPFLKSIKYLGYGIWLKNRIKKDIVKIDTVHYSYWMDYWAIALALSARKKIITSFVSRAHRYDLYTGTGEHALDFFKPFTINYLRKLYLISENGLSFINNLHPEYSKKYCLSRLGSSDPGFVSPQNSNNNVVLVSCSNLKPLKRVNLILDALIRLNKAHPEAEITWFHIGEGEILGQLVRKAEEMLGGKNIQCNFKGSLSNSEVIEFYHNQPVDVFLNVSETEGIPVSIMEAQSFGIPVIATATGGTPEIVNNANGLLLNVNLDPEVLSEILYRVYSDKAGWADKRARSRKSWEDNFKAENNYRSFSLELAGLQTSME